MQEGTGPIVYSNLLDVTAATTATTTTNRDDDDLQGTALLCTARFATRFRRRGFAGGLFFLVNRDASGVKVQYSKLRSSTRPQGRAAIPIWICWLTRSRMARVRRTRIRASLPPVLTVSAVGGSDRLMVIVLPRVRVLYVSGLQVGLFARRIDTMLE